MPEILEIINPLDYPDWDTLLLTAKDYSFFHSSYWARVLHKSYNYKPLYFSIVRNGRLLALIPFVEVKSLLTGKKGVSLPFSDYCETIIPEKDTFQDIFGYLVNHGKKTGWKSIEIRDGHNFPQNCLPASSYYRHTLDLSRNDEQIFSNFRDSTKRNIDRAKRKGVEVHILKSLESLNEFYRLNCITRKKHGLPPQPYYFFREIYEHIISKDMGFIDLASYKGVNIAGAIYFHLGDKAIYKYGASDMDYQHLRANNLVMWEAMKWYAQNGYRNFCFGRTEPDNHGLLQFKEGWGATQQLTKYYKYDLKQEIFIQGSLRVSSIYNRIFHKIPIPVLRLAGSVLYKYIG